MTQPVHIRPPDRDRESNARELIETQQQTIRFLLGQWDALVAQVAIGGGKFGVPQILAVGAKVPSGWWQTIVPAVVGTTIGTVTIGTSTINIFSGLFWSDGNVTVSLTGGITIARVAVMETGSA